MAVSRTWEIPCETEAPHGPLDYSCSGGASRFRRPLLLLFVSVLRGRFAAVKRIHVKVALARRVTRKGAFSLLLMLGTATTIFCGRVLGAIPSGGASSRSSRILHMFRHIP